MCDCVCVCVWVCPPVVGSCRVLHLYRNSIDLCLSIGAVFPVHWPSLLTFHISFLFLFYYRVSVLYIVSDLWKMNKRELLIAQKAYLSRQIKNESIAINMVRRLAHMVVNVFVFVCV
jgi:hypothetical protein